MGTCMLFLLWGWRNWDCVIWYTLTKLEFKAKILIIYFLTTTIKYFPSAIESIEYVWKVPLEMKTIDFHVLGKQFFLRDVDSEYVKL